MQQQGLLGIFQQCEATATPVPATPLITSCSHRTCLCPQLMGLLDLQQFDSNTRLACFQVLKPLQVCVTASDVKDHQRAAVTEGYAMNTTVTLLRYLHSAIHAQGADLRTCSTGPWHCQLLCSAACGCLCSPLHSGCRLQRPRLVGA